METWRYVPRGRMRHAIEYDRAPRSICGLVKPWSPDEWRGAGTQDEYETVAALPDCQRCATRVGPAVVAQMTAEAALAVA